MSESGKVVLLSGGVGGAKLALGFARILPGARLAVIANTGDDFEHLGLHVSPDIDTLLYTLSELADPVRGWGRRDETWNFMAALRALGGEDWFNLGDGDLALHVWRSHLLAAGRSLSEVTDAACRALGIEAAILPMSDDPVATVVESADGPLAFQHYFVRDECRPEVRGFRFEGARSARLNPRLGEMLAGGGVAAIVIAPSNPFVSIGPILAVAGLREALAACAAPVLAVSPIVGGQALKGPAAKMMAELGLSVSARGVAEHYRDLLDGMVIDERDRTEAAPIGALGLEVLVTGTVMRDLADRKRLAEACLEFAARLRPP